MAAAGRKRERAASGGGVGGGKGREGEEDRRGGQGGRGGGGVGNRPVPMPCAFVPLPFSCVRPSPSADFTSPSSRLLVSLTPLPPPGNARSIVASTGGPRGHDDGGYVPKTPTRAALMERNQTLVGEVRFADQTCVALAERKKFYKNQAGQHADGLRTATATRFRPLGRITSRQIKESARLKVLVESGGDAFVRRG